MSVFDDYLATLADPVHRARMAEVLAWVSQTYPTLAPRIAWNQPMFTDHGTFIIGFSAARDHWAASPEEVVITRFAAKIAKAGFEHSKMLIRFPWGKPVDHDLLGTVIAYNITGKASVETFWRPCPDSPDSPHLVSGLVCCCVIAHGHAKPARRSTASQPVRPLRVSANRSFG